MPSRVIGNNIEVKVAECPEIIVALVDKSQLENAVLNLCVNARDAEGRPAGALCRKADLEEPDVVAVWRPAPTC